MEAPKPRLEEVEPEPKPAPRFTAGITSPAELHEGQPAHFETTVEPVDDANLKIQWYLNGAPVAASNRAKVPAHFETTVEPVDDANLKIQWYLNGAPVAASNRAKVVNDFGWIILNLSSVTERDSGTWECVATNAAGEARVSTELTVQGKDVILGDVQHE
uniref:Ig-like domain-containing protein n=1 Tax=Panagrolaimus sp. ES5 TaxID=591445 RepID=A0AC34GGU1_9BILA